MSIWAEVAAWFALPLILFVTAAGVGLLVERVCGADLPGPLLAPLGACASIVLLMPLAQAGLGAWPGVAVLLAATVAGIALRRGELRAQVIRVSGGWAGLSGLLVFGLYLAPTALTGHWTWSGYNFVNDTAFQFLLTDWVANNGIPYDPLPVSTTSETIRVYLATRYPVGSQVHLAALSTMLGVPGEVVYTSYISALVALTAMALATLARRAAGSARWAAATAFVAASASLTYHYALQGNIKEMGMLLAVATAVAAGRELLASERPVRAVVPVAVALAAGLAAYNAAALPYAGAIGGAIALAALLQPGAAMTRRRLPAAVALGLVAVAVLSIPVLTVVADSLFVLRGTFSNTGAAGAGETLAHLVRPLPFTQIGGIWLDGDYRIPVAGRPADIITDAGLFLVFMLAAIGVASCLRRRESAPLILLGAGLLIFLVLAPRTSPYADAKMLALLSPALVLCGMLGAAAVARRAQAVGVVIAAVVATLVVGSAAFAYHDVNLAPTDRMDDLADIGERYAGSDQLMLFNEYEEFAKYFIRDARINAPTESMTESFIELRAGGDFPGRSFDLDEITLSYVERFPLVILRRKPTASRPPANFRLEYRNASYAVWRRMEEPVVVEHMPLQGPDDALDEPDCRELRKLAGRAEPGMMLVAAGGPEIATFDFVGQEDRPAGWNLDALRPGELVLGTPGIAGGTLTVRGGSYQAWLEGTFGRPMELSVDGRPIGAAEGINTPRGWLRAGTVSLEPGEHRVEVRRPGGGLAPGDGARTSLGAVALVGAGRTDLSRIEPAEAERLCGRQLDWVELVRPESGALRALDR